MKFLFLIRDAIYLRNYESVLRTLAQNGHRIELAVTHSKGADDTLLRLLPQQHPEISEVAVPKRTGSLQRTLDRLRTTRDYLRYFEPMYADAPHLASRRPTRRGLHLVFENFQLGRHAWLRGLIHNGVSAFERITPPDPAIQQWIGARKPDAVLVTPLVNYDYVQVETLKAARSLGIPSALMVASWDNLTNKGLIQYRPDRVVLWNDAQRREAETMHGIPPAVIRVTGAQLYDPWFEMQPHLSREAFCAAHGFDAKAPIILYACSSSSICPNEVGFVRRWLGAIRASDDPLLRSVNVLVRPHPLHGEQWKGQTLDGLGPVAIAPREGAAPLDDERKHDYFDALYRSACVVGINTSCFLEAAIIGRRTLTLHAEEFPQSQEGTIHFRYLAGGLLQVADSLDTHLGDIATTLRTPGLHAEELRDFVADFLRPNGIDRPCTAMVVQELEALAAAKRS